ncbi:Neuronal acetylcholine receptor subunit alpha-3 [Holothuria leucospilota]|uniref:Neuronal acetylcholine receptor subunit alpha-3 n=1 Tax=Holothuria leucospilota TaxID=206669 RepID=A0A9Q1CD87_HOLLE|nr:Neuronal acetylcholine receptor subunit alpha-3 [Holothuria leucospilota]
MGCFAFTAENRLRNTLFRNYSYIAIPVKHPSDVLNVSFELALDQIIELNVKSQLMTTKVWVMLIWHDYKLAWDPAEYDDITDIKIPSSYIWVPDILMYNNANGSFEMNQHTSPSIHYDGQVTWFPPAVYQSACRINVRYFPFDEQICSLKFGSWSYTEDHLDLIPKDDQVVERDFWPNEEWFIMNAPCERNAEKYPCCEGKYVDITCSFVLRRQPVYHVAYLLVPCGLISFNTILVFYLPPLMSEKMSLCTSVMLSMIWFMLLITQRIPSNANDPPLIVQYLIFSLTVVVTSLLYNVCIINMKNRHPVAHPMPRWVRSLFLMTLPPWVGLKKPERWQKSKKETTDVRTAPLQIKRITIPYPPEDPSPRDPNASFNLRRPSTDSQHSQIDTAPDALCNSIMSSPPLSRRKKMLLKASQGASSLSKPSSSDTNNNHGNNDITRRVLAEFVTEIKEDISYLHRRFEQDEIFAGLRQDWTVVAMVIDRIFLIVYIVGLIAGSTAIIMDAPLASEFFVNYILSPNITNESYWVK